MTAFGAAHGHDDRLRWDVLLQGSHRKVLEDAHVKQLDISPCGRSRDGITAATTYGGVRSIFSFVPSKSEPLAVNVGLHERQEASLGGREKAYVPRRVVSWTSDAERHDGPAVRVRERHRC